MYIFTSDLHFQDKSVADDGWHAEKPFLSFMEFYAPDIKIVLGDFLSLETPLECIIKAYHKLFCAIYADRNLLWLLPGNHDRDIGALAALGFTILPPVYVIEYGKWRALVLHGDKFDYFNRGNASIGQIVTRLAGWVERHGWQGADDVLGRLWSKVIGQVNSIDDACFGLASQLGCNAFIHGHDHLPHVASRDGIIGLDCGTWTRRFEYGYPYVVMTEDSVTLEYWEG